MASCLAVVVPSGAIPVRTPVPEVFDPRSGWHLFRGFDLGQGRARAGRKTMGAKGGRSRLP